MREQREAWSTLELKTSVIERGANLSVRIQEFLTDVRLYHPSCFESFRRKRLTQLSNRYSELHASWRDFEGLCRSYLSMVAGPVETTAAEGEESPLPPSLGTHFSLLLFGWHISTSSASVQSQLRDAGEAVNSAYAAADNRAVMVVATLTLVFTVLAAVLALAGLLQAPAY